MYEPEDKRLSTTHQADLLSVNRSSLYQRPRKPSQRELESIQIMHRIDEIYTDHPYYGYRRIHAVLQKEMSIGKNRVLSLMRRMGVYAIYPKRNLSKRYQKQYIHPYLLRNLPIRHKHQVWSVDITYVRMGVGFMYLFAIIDLYTRYIIDYELSSTLEKEFVLRCLDRAYAKQLPGIQNSDQGGHFTNEAYVNLLKEHGIRISMDSRGRALDNIYIERFFRSLKYEEIYLNEYRSPRALRRAIESYIDFYNYERPHQALEYQIPGEVFHQDDIKEKRA